VTGAVDALELVGVPVLGCVMNGFARPKTRAGFSALQT